MQKLRVAGDGDVVRGLWCLGVMLQALQALHAAGHTQVLCSMCALKSLCVDATQ